jgi:hypothetical protein
MARAGEEAFAEVLAKNMARDAMNTAHSLTADICKDLKSTTANLEKYGILEVEGVKLEKINGEYHLKTETGTLRLSELSDVRLSGAEQFDKLANVLSEAQYTKWIEELKNPGFRTDKEFAQSLEKSLSPPVTEARDVRYGKSWTQSAKELLNTDIAKWVVQFGALAGVTYLVCESIATQSTGCWLVDIKTGNKIQKVSGGESQCNCGGKPPESQPDTTLAEHAGLCEMYCDDLKDAAIRTPDMWSDCLVSCACKMKGSNGPVLQKKQYGFKWIKEDAWSVFTGIVAGAGAFINDITEAGLDIVKQIANPGFLKWLIPVIIIVIIIAIVVPIVVDAAKKKKMGGGALASYGWDGWSEWDGWSDI